MRIEILLLLVVFIAFSLADDKLVDDCSEGSLASDPDECLHAREGSVYPDDYCAYCLDGNNDGYCMTTTEADKTDARTWYCFYQSYTGGWNSTEVESIKTRKELILNALNKRKMENP